VLDLLGKSEEARKYFTKAIDVAETSEESVHTRSVPCKIARPPTLSDEIEPQKASAIQTRVLDESVQLIDHSAEL
jgi:hypothetical protein